MDFITQAEKEKIQSRLTGLIANRPIIAARIQEARAQGDLKENADYHAAREDQGMEEAEIKRLEARLAHAMVASEDEVPEDMVFLGAIVKLLDIEDKEEDLYKLVGEATGDFDAEEIEVTAQSPMGEALMKARVGDEVKVDLPAGAKRFRIVEIVT